MHATKGAEALTHEMVHAILPEDLPRVPTWFDEGLASLFEAPGSVARVRSRAS